MSRWALVPIKGFDRAKSRLSEILAPNEREGLARALFEHVVRVLRESPSIDGIAVVSDSVEVCAYAERLGAAALRDADGAEGLAGVVDTALLELQLRGATSVIICMGDLPDLAVQDITRVAEELDEHEVVLVPDLSQRGTNVIAVRPATVLPSCLGHEDSLRRHCELARDLGLSVSVQLSTRIGFDVDHPGDLARLRGR
jgi:2-phospho-L-lactate guanylyltransferase